MAETIRIRTDQLVPELRKRFQRVPQLINTAIKRAADRWVVYLREQVDKEGITVTGDYRDSFTVRVVGGRVVVANDHPAAGVIEEGCAPHPVSEEGQENIRLWCVMKLGLYEAEAREAAFLICRKIREHGQEPRYPVRRALPQLFVFVEEEVQSVMRSLR